MDMYMYKYMEWTVCPFNVHVHWKLHGYLQSTNLHGKSNMQQFVQSFHKSSILINLMHV